MQFLCFTVTFDKLFIRCPETLGEDLNRATHGATLVLFPRVQTAWRVYLQTLSWNLFSAHITSYIPFSASSGPLNSN